MQTHFGRRSSKLEAMRALLYLTALAVLGSTAVGCVRTYRGIVYEDKNRDGQVGDDEPGVPNAVVAYGHGVFGTTAADGSFELTVIDGATGVVWVRVPDGYRPGPVYATLGAANAIELGVRRLATPQRGPLTFVLTSDSHVSPRQPFGADLAATLASATALSPLPAFVVITGDITQSDEADNYDLVDEQVAGLRVPYVPVPGNHDWYTGGAMWISRQGPDNYSFDLGNYHFVIWNMMMAEEDIHEYLGKELALVDPGMTVIAMSHAPPIPTIIDTLKRLGVDYVLSGHTHTNRAVDHGGMIELTTQPLMMGGLDQMPGGYRVVTLDGPTLRAYHRTTLDAPQLVVNAPTAAACVPRTGARVVVAAELDASIPTVTATVDCGAPITLDADGGWSYTGVLATLAPGWHSLQVEAVTATGGHSLRALTFEVCDEGVASVPTLEWPQTGGGPEHAAATPTSITPPLAPRWTATVGGNVVHASPVIADGAVFVTGTDLGDGTTGGIVAIELATGIERWRVTTSLAVRGAPAVVGDVVAIGQLDGSVLGLDTRTGAQRWERKLGEGLQPEAASFFASAAADSTSFVLGNQRNLAAIDAATGALAWTADPVPGGRYSQSLAAVAIASATAAPPNGLVVGAFHRDQGGITAWDRATGTMRWRLNNGEDRNGIQAAPVISGDTVYLVGGKASVLAVSLAIGAVKWSRSLHPDGFEWGQASAGSPAIASNVIVVPTMLRELVALDATTGAERWRFAGQPTMLRSNHYLGAGQSGFESGPVITGAAGSELVWAADLSGRLVALDLRTGALQWETELGVPVIAGLAAAGDWLVVASYDGSVRALAPTTRAVVDAPVPVVCAMDLAAPEDGDEAGGCCDANGAAPGSLALGAMVLGLLGRGGRRRRNTSQRRIGSGR